MERGARSLGAGRAGQRGRDSPPRPAGVVPEPARQVAAPEREVPAARGSPRAPAPPRCSRTRSRSAVSEGPAASAGGGDLPALGPQLPRPQRRGLRAPRGHGRHAGLVGGAPLLGLRELVRSPGFRTRRGRAGSQGTPGPVLPHPCSSGPGFDGHLSPVEAPPLCLASPAQAQVSL